MIDIKEVKTRKDVKQFATFPLKLYKGCPYYVPSLLGDEMATFNPKKNANLEHCDIKGFLCFKDGELVGRIAGIIQRKANEIYSEKAVRFSRFECIDDLEVFKALLGAVEKYGKENGMEVIHGPWGFNDTDREGMLTSGFDRRSTYATNYYYPYFSENMKKLGWADESKWVEKKFVVPEENYERLARLSKRLKEKLNLVDVTEIYSVKKIIKLYGKKLFETVNDAYGHLDGYVPVEGRMIDDVLAQFGTVCNRKYLSILVDKNDDVAAFAVVLPSICNAIIKNKGRLFPFGFIDVLKSISKPDELEMALIGVKSTYKNTGINAIMINKIVGEIIADGITDIESNPMLETNYSIQQQWKFSDNEVIKTRQTYVKNIEI